MTPEEGAALRELRDRVRWLITELYGEAVTDEVGDFLVRVGEAAVWVRPERQDGRNLVRVWSITNVDVRVEAALARHLLSLNAAVPFGGFRLDVRRPAVVFADTLLGDYLNRAELSVTVAAAATMTMGQAPVIKERFGGRLFGET